MVLSIRKLITLLLLPLCFINLAFGQAISTKTIEIVTKVRDEAVSPVANVTVAVYEKGLNKPLATYTTPNNGNVSFTLDLYHEYIITFSKKDFATKQIWLDGNVAGKENKTKLSFAMEYIVYMYAFSSDKLGAELINKPFTKIVYNPATNDFFIDKEYESAMKMEVAKLTVQARAELVRKLVDGGSDTSEPNKQIVKFVKPVMLREGDDGFNFSGSTIKELVKKNQERSEQSTLSLATVSIYIDSEKLVELKTDKKDGSFKTKLPYGYVYKVVVSHPSTVPGFMLIDARLPKEKYSIRTGVEVANIPCIDKKSVNVDTVKYRFAFDKYMFDGKQIVRDKKYFEEFLNGNTREYLDYRAMLREQKGNVTSIPLVASEKINYITGKIFSGNPPSTPVKSVKVILVGDRGEPLQTCVTNNFGRFLFSDVVLDQHYTLKIDDEDMKHLAGQKLTIINRNDKEVTVISADERGKFTFRLLTSDKKTLELLASEDESLIITGNLLALINNITQPVANTKIQLTNEKGEMVEAVLTNEFGTFVFTKVPPNKSFLIELAENNPKLANVKVIITDRNGKEVNSAICNSEGKFKFEFLKQDELKLDLMEVEESALRLDLKGKLFKNSTQQTLSNAKLDLVNEKDQVVQSTTSDKAGNFKFSKVNYEKNYSLIAASPQTEKVILADAAGVVIQEYKTGSLVNTIKMPLLSADQQKLTTVSLDDPWLKVSAPNSDNKKQETVIIPEKVYFELNDFKITTEGKVILDKVIQVMKGNSKVKIEVSSHTDSQGSDEYNMDLSKKRAKSAVDYMTTQGIAKERVTGVGYGETKLVNKCSNGELCSEDEHAQNRRLEFKVMPIN